MLLDVQMPGLSGPELQDQLTKSGSLLSIMFLSGQGDIHTSVRAIKAGAAGQTCAERGVAGGYRTRFTAV